MSSFAKEFAAELKSGGTIDGVMVGLGPASELRYPSYQDAYWKYCGVGEFQCYDAFMLEALQAAATSSGHPEWGHGGPNNAGTYNSRPGETGFFGSGSDNYASAYGQFFLAWYSEMLLKHGVNVLEQARKAFGSSFPLGAKVSGIHWWYDDQSHAAELTAGYYNTNGHNAYLTIAQAISKRATLFDFTCLEMTDSPNGVSPSLLPTPLPLPLHTNRFNTTSTDCGSKPVEIVSQAASGAHAAGMDFDGENALELCNPNCYKGGFDQIVAQTKANRISHFTYLRLTRNLLDDPNNWAIFTDFVSRMAAI